MICVEYFDLCALELKIDALMQLAQGAEEAELKNKGKKVQDMLPMDEQNLLSTTTREKSKNSGSQLIGLYIHIEVKKYKQNTLFTNLYKE